MQIGPKGHNIFTQLHGMNSLIVGKVFIGWARKVFVPSFVAYSIKNNALKAVIVLYGPLNTLKACHLRHDFFGKVHIATDQVSFAVWAKAHIVSVPSNEASIYTPLTPKPERCDVR
jgi:hypothetical protein